MMIYLFYRLRYGATLFSEASDMLIEGAVVYSIILIFLMLRYLVTIVTYMFCLMCASVTSLCVLMFVVCL